VALYDFFSKVASLAGTTSVYLYNIPSNVKNTISPELFARLSKEHPNIAGIKDSSQNFETYCKFIDAKQKEQVALIGNESQLLPALVMGGEGCVSAASSAFPELFVGIYQAYQQGN